ncbi:acylphosphatase [Pantoea allii]|uniref:acylphosphatase n=1 Tax=Pantoea allii TaxID=574096 RepID=UPI001F4D3CD8|nr:acylphosphatase [Pantoea allii]MCH9296553.1 acylphosphatase [Pantoea allii]MDJ0040303.1 acylphosphatase [Pantoea allii]MDJ0090747.1 acylphosphatase [Pantoea allii]
MAMVCYKAWVQGTVQGVGFRYSTQAKANALGVKGYARNLDDGRVEVLASGEAEQVEALVAWLKAGGPRTAQVENVWVEPHQPTDIPQRFTTG